MMAGMAISPLLKMKGENAMAIAWAAFCIPTSMTMVRRTAGVKPVYQGAPKEYFSAKYSYIMPETLFSLGLN